jgi:WD40 repeat protein
MAYLTPGSDPLDFLETVLQGSKRPSLLVVDQFEELFTLCTDDVKRRTFLARLLRLPAQLRVILTMRADFWGECAPYRELKDLMQARQELIAPMDAAELRRAMEMQAAMVGLRFEADLSNTILDDVQGEPGAMPLLQHALLELWKRRHGRWLRAEEYRAIGGVKKAIAETAEAVYRDLSSHEQGRVRDVFVRLSRLDEELRDTRKRVWLEELVPAGTEASATKALVNRLANARLVVTGDQTVAGRQEVEIAHESLIRYWPRLRGWLEEDRTSLRLRQAVSEAAREWQVGGQDKSLLIHRGARLREAEALWRPGAIALNEVERAYLASCATLEEGEKRRGRRVRRVVAGLAAGLLLATALGSVGVWQWQVTEGLRNDAVEARNIAQEAKNIASALDLAAQSELARVLHPERPEAGVLLAVESLRLYPSLQADLALRRGLALLPREKARFDLEPKPTQPAAHYFSPGGRYLARSAREREHPRKVRVWDVTSKREVLSVAHDREEPTPVAFSANDGQFAVATGPRISVWETATGRRISQVEHAGGVWCLVLHPDGLHMASGGLDGNIRVWEVANGQEVFHVSHTFVRGALFSPNGKYLVTWSAAPPSLKLWHVSSGQPAAEIDRGEEPTYGVAIDSDSKYLVACGSDRVASLWQLETGKPVVKLEHEHKVDSAVFSANGKYVVTQSQDFTRIWEVARGREIARLGHWTLNCAMAPSRDRAYVVTGGVDELVQISELSTGRLVLSMDPRGRPLAVTFAPGGAEVAAATSKGELYRWEATGHQGLAVMEHRDPPRTLALSLDGRLAATTSWMTARVWETLTGRALAAFEHEEVLCSLAFNPKGRFLAMGGSGKTVTVREVDTGKAVLTRRLEDSEGHGVWALAFSPDGNFLAAASNQAIRVLEIPGGRDHLRLAADSPVQRLAFTPDGRYLVAKFQNSVKVLDVTAEKEIDCRIRCDWTNQILALSRDGLYLATAGPGIGASCVVCETATGREVANLQHPGQIRRVAFGPDGTTLATSCDDNRVRVWDVLAGKERSQLILDDRADGVVFSPDGGLLATAGAQAIVWNLATGRPAARIELEEPATEVVFLEDGRYLATAGLTEIAGRKGSRKVHVWLLRPDDLIAAAGSRLTRNLTPEEWQQHFGMVPYRKTFPDLP